MSWQGREVCFGDGPHLGKAGKHSSAAACGLHQWRPLLTARESDINIFEEETREANRDVSARFLSMFYQACATGAARRIVCVPS